MRGPTQGSFRRPPAGLLAGIIRIAAQVLMRLVLSLMLSIVIEWAGLTWLWADQGLSRGQRMIAAERQYLSRDHDAGQQLSKPLIIANGIAHRFDQWLFEWPRINHFIAWLDGPLVAGTRDAHARLHQWARPHSRYLKAARQSTELFALRLSLLILSLPVFLICGVLGLIDGLVQRDLRRWGGGRESSFVYHHAKGSLAPLIGFASMIYLASPISLSPAAILLPFALAFGVSLMMTARTFKKYL